MQQVFEDIIFNEIDSTQTYAKANYEKYKDRLVAIRALNQTAGRGQYDRKWESNSKKNILVTFVIPSLFKNFNSLPTLPLITGLTVIQTIKQLFKTDLPLLKWLNDVYMNNKKISGALIESDIIGQEIILYIGIGINIDSSPDYATNLQEALKLDNLDQEILYKELKNNLLKNIILLNDKGFGYFHKELNESLFKNTEIKRFIDPKTQEFQFEGFIERVNENGELIIRDKNGLLIIIQKQVRMEI